VNSLNQQGTDPASNLRGGTISAIFGSQASSFVHYCKRDEVYFTTVLSQNNGWQNGLISRNAVFRIQSYFCRF